MKSSINLPDTFCDNLRQLMHEIFNIPYTNFNYDFKNDIVTLYGPCIALPYHTEYIEGRQVEGQVSYEPTQSHRLKYSFSNSKVTVWKVSLPLDGSKNEEEKRVYTVAGIKEWTAVELMHLKRQLMKGFPPDIIVGPCIEGV